MTVWAPRFLVKSVREVVQIYLTAARIPPGRFIGFIGSSVNWSHFGELWTNLKVFVSRLGSILEAQGFAF